MTQPITCFIEYDIEPWARELFGQYVQWWGTAIPECGAELIGYFAPHEGSLSKAYGVYTLPSLAAYESYKAKLANHPIAQEAYAFAQRERFIRYEERTFLRRADHAGIPDGERRD